jgi:magnesium-transporting ATPase (P-type)
MGVKLGAHRPTILETLPQIHQIPYEPEQQYAATYHRDHGAVRVFVKGAPERVLGMCVEPPAAPLATAEQMAGDGLRVLAFAEGEASAEPDPSATPAEPANLRFLGLAGMIDPLRGGVREAVQACHRAGIDVCMITGDHPVTALAISRDLGLASQPEQVVTGRMLDGRDEAYLRKLLQTARVFARVTPRQKLELVNAARKNGHFVAVTGDGVNDAPALRAANIGVAMGKAGTDVARDASDIVLSDDNFASIVAGIEEGRVAYDNVRKVIYLLISCGAAELLALGAAVVMGMPMPLLPVQILWVNLVTNGIQGVALAFEPNEGDVLSRRPRDPEEPVFNRLMVERTLLSAVFMATVMVSAFSWMLRNGWPIDSARNILLLMLVLFENFHIGNSRSETKSAFLISPLRSRLLLAGTACALAVHGAAMYTGFGRSIIKTEAVDLTTWLVLLAATSSIVAVMELHKLSWAWRSRRR